MRPTLAPHTRRLVQKLLARYCSRVCPPSFRHSPALGFRLGAHEAVIHELRNFCGVPGAPREVPVARLRLQRDGRWCLDYADLEARWRRHSSPPHRSFVALLRVLDEDPGGVFWSSVNGKSLRWCSARGRCAECTRKYQRILGAALPGARVVPLPRASEPDALPGQ